MKEPLREEVENPVAATTATVVPGIMSSNPASQRSRKPPTHPHPMSGIKGGNCCTKKFPIFADLAEDYLHDRWVVALGFLLIFTVVSRSHTYIARGPADTV